MLKDCERCNCPERGEFPQGLAKARTTSVSGQNDKSRQHLFAQHWLRSDTLFTEFCKFFSGAAFGLFFAGFDRHCFHMHCGITIYMEFKSLFKYQNSIINTCCHKCMMNEQCTPTCTSTQFCYLKHSIKSVNVAVNVTNAPSVNHTQQNINESKSHSGN